jgi:hypothetical protein
MVSIGARITHFPAYAGWRFVLPNGQLRRQQDWRLEFGQEGGALHGTRG